MNEEDGPELVYVDIDNKHYYDDIRFIQGYERKDQFLFAMAFGFINDFHPPLKRKDFITRTSYLKNDMPIINALALLISNGDVDILSNRKEVFKIAEEYANGGIQLLSDEKRFKYGTFEKSLEKILVDIYDKIVDTDSSTMIEEPKIIKRSKIDKYLEEGENEELEFKSSLIWDLKEKCKNKNLEKVIAKTIAAFLNTKGGFLLIGVTDEGSIFGIEEDLNFVKGRDIDGFQMRLREIIKNYLGLGFAGNIKINFTEKDDKTVCIVKVDRSKQPVYLKDKERNDVKEFYVRIGSTSNALDPEQTNIFVSNNF